MGKFIIGLIIFIAAVIVSLYFGAIKIYNYSSENIDLQVWVEPVNVSLSDGTFTISCKIENLTGKPVEFDGFFTTTGPHLGWCSWTGNKPKLMLEKPDGVEISLIVYNKLDNSGASRSLDILPEEGLQGKGTYSAQDLNLVPGDYIIAFVLMGKTRETRFTISE